MVNNHKYISNYEDQYAIRYNTKNGDWQGNVSMFNGEFYNNLNNNRSDIWNG